MTDCSSKKGKNTTRLILTTCVALGLTLWMTLGFEYMLWGIWTRCALVYHATWFVNSATHKWGYRNYPTRDDSTNNWWVALLSARSSQWRHAQPGTAKSRSRSVPAFIMPPTKSSGAAKVSM
jgi:fatty-acid desaturase